ncbi:exodeoxyribonuclease III [Corynebacterium sp. sy017]|uniref:exodeoxyribonuclease III n=1 Tax=unclassified Corynebacterium TaxID=2624378 RepID=UPI001186B5A0|nr:MULTISPECIES: exodeoxyribonuclease III [unclassified Corynebacterium]MBP3088686.1 exodeoxyribonuclease III [Corynebacterium sp. sy017]QDZ42087.1 exodeoxyribonuclease III [Corynebacterium sp. sy039]TSD91974.1 exodeoxyribonuclease III [Corynebacterium sp. SY003]
MQITTVNVNGIRAAVKQRSAENQGFLAWLEQSGSDIVLLQEVRASDKDTDAALAPAYDDGWYYVGAPSSAKGRAGVGILSRTKLSDVQIGLEGFEESGRFISACYDDNGTDVTVASLYLPSGSANTAKQDEKYEFLDVFADYLAEKGSAGQDKQMVIGGDWNICHREQDLKNFKGNYDKSGFLADERAFMDHIFGAFPDEQPQDKDAGSWAGAVEYSSDVRREAATDPMWFDVARRLAPEGAPYTWWSYRGQAFDNDAGWRIDYQAVTESLLQRAQTAWVDKAERYDLRWSDHSPLTVVYRDL